MNSRVTWIAIVIVLALTMVTVANCRKLDPWVPQAESGDAQPQRSAGEN